MVFIIYVILGIFVFSVIAVLFGILEHNAYVKNLAKKYSYEEIEEKINKDLEEINTENYKGAMLESVLDHKELWEQVKTYKNTHNL